MQNVLVTGGAGFIGSNFVLYLLATQPDVHLVNLDALTYAGCMQNLDNITDENRYEFIKGSILNQPLLDRIFQEHRIDTVVHFAAETHVDRSIYDPRIFLDTNITGTYTLLEAARNAWLDQQWVPLQGCRFHQISTDEVYGTLTPNDPPFFEAQAYAPRSPYSASKASADHFVRAFGNTYGLPFTISNCSNNYGPRQYPEKLIPLITLNAVGGKTLPVYGDGLQIRDWIYVEDHCRAVMDILARGQLGSTYNIGGGNQPTNLEIVQHICSILDELQPDPSNHSYADRIEFVIDRRGHDRRYAMDTSMIEIELEWKPRETLDSGLRKTIQWYLEHPEWVAAVKMRPDYQEWIALNYQERGGLA